MNYTMAQAKRDFERGFIRSASLVSPKPSEGGWWVLLGAGGFEGPLVDARSREVRYFKTTDAAVRAVEQIGLKVDALIVGVRA